jgi:hypothetical protein
VGSSEAAAIEGTASAGSNPAVDFLTSTQTLAQLHALMPLQWSNTIESLEVSARCAPRRLVPRKLTATLCGGIEGVWDESVAAYVPRGLDTVLAARDGRRAAREADNANRISGTAQTGPDAAAHGDGGALPDSPSPTFFRGNIYEDSDDSYASEAADGAPVAPHVAERQNLKYASLRSRHADVMTADELSSELSYDALSRSGSAADCMLPPDRTVKQPVRAMAVVRKERPGSSQTPCVFIRQVIMLHNADGSVALSSAAGGCTCRHRDDGAHGSCGAAVVTPVDPSPGDIAANLRLYSSVSGHVAAPSEAGADVPMPLSQQLSQPQEEPRAASSTGPKRLYTRRPRGVLKSREWLLKDVIDGTATKFVVSEALCRACDRLRVFIPKQN